jgi:C-terminal processing protease CtpA/Prc
MKIFFRITFLFLSFLLIACNKDDEDETTIKIVNTEIYDLMKEVYLWNDKLPEVNPKAYSSPEALMDALRYDAYDKWSAVITKTEYSQYFENGEMIGHGFLLALDGDDNIRIAFLYRGTQAYNLGIKRGWIVKKVNGTTATASNVFDLLGPSETGRLNTLSFLDENGEPHELSLTKEVIHITPVIFSKVIRQDATNIGYMVFQDYIDAANEELDTLFTSFAAAGIDEMIVDLRYNGGGSVEVAENLAGWLIGKNNGDKPFVNFRHNTKYARWDTTLNVPANASGLSLNRVFFITTGSTASASELTINGVKPYLSEIGIAGSTTHGKPVGMYAFPFNNYDYVVLPVTFKYTNAADEGDFYDGITPTLLAGDDLTRDFGNPDEESLGALLDYIRGGTVPLKSAATTVSESRIIRPQQAIHEYLKAY